MARLLISLCLCFGCLSLYANEDVATLRPELKLVLDNYMNAVNQIDVDGIAATYHFPHFRVAGGKLVVWHTPLEALPMLNLPPEKRRAAMRKALGERWHVTRWVKQELVAISADKAHINTEFVRLAKDGSELASYNSLYILARVDGDWKIKGRSSFAQ